MEDVWSSRLELIISFSTITKLSTRLYWIYNNENIEVDEIVLSEKLSSSGNLETVGGQDALLELTSRIDTTAHAPFWLDIVKQKALLRKCIYIAYEIIDGANHVQGNADDFLAGMEQKVCSLGDEQNERSSIPFREPINHAMEQIQRMLSRKKWMVFLRDTVIWIILRMVLSLAK